jgi:hypothetical protein
MSPRQREPWTPWTPAVAQAIAGAPVSIRTLAERAHVSHAELARIAAGQRNATRAVATSVMRALERLAVSQRDGAAFCERHAEALRRALGRSSRKTR